METEYGGDGIVRESKVCVDSRLLKNSLMRVVHFFAQLPVVRGDKKPLPCIGEDSSSSPSISFYPWVLGISDHSSAFNFSPLVMPSLTEFTSCIKRFISPSGVGGYSQSRGRMRLKRQLLGLEGSVAYRPSMYEF